MCGKCVRFVGTRGPGRRDARTVRQPNPAPASQGPRFPSRRAFVVQFANGGDPEAGRYVGRVEHVVSGRGRRFRSRAELLRFMATMLRDLSNNEEESGE